MTLAPGARLGTYEITSPLGKGGMGEVFRARDTKLNRDVAIKVLPELFASDAERLARFTREAQTLAALNHPNIAHIHGLEESGGVRALVMELVEGEDLSAQIARGPIPIAEALPIARQIADALEAAHEQGIVHRDLKPANIKVRADGTVKVLDFGLAKAMEPASASGADATNSPTLTARATQMGMIIGTAAYMAPEQARGKAVDRRGDVWSFGVVLYEMLTGERAFKGDDISETLASVLRDTPSLDTLPAAAPPRIKRLLERCLDRDPKTRLRDIGEARVEIARIEAGAPDAAAVSAPVATVGPRSFVARVLPWALVAAFGVALVAGAIGGVGVWRFTPSAHLSVTRFSFPLADGQQFTRGGHQSVAMSPDGTQIVYVANNRLYVRSMSELEARAIPGTESGAESPAFSPDGQSIAFRSVTDSTLKRIAVTGGAAVTICPAGTTFGLSWSSDGILFGQGAQGILRVSADGGKPVVLIAVKSREEAHGPQLLSDGQHVLFTLATGTGGSRWDNAQIVVQSLKSGERKTLVSGGTDGRYLPTGHLVYGLGGVLFAVPFDPRRLELAGGPVPIVEGVRSSGSLSGSLQFSVSNTGSLVYIPGPVRTASDLWEVALVDRKGTVERLKLPAGGYAYPRVSPDGKRIAVGVDDGKDSDVWIYELSGASAMRRLTFGGRNRLPIWSPDSRRVAFQSDREGDNAIFWQSADGTGTAERLTKPEQGTSHSPESWSPDGTHVLFSATTGSNVSLWTFSLPDKRAAPFGGVQSSEPTNAVFSPDGRWVAYTSTEGGRRIFVQPFPATGAKYEIASKGAIFYPVWSADGKELLWNRAGVSVTTRPSFTFGNPVEAPIRGLSMTGPAVPRTYDVTPDGKFIGTLSPASNRTDAPTPPTFQVVLNWFEELKTKAIKP